MNDDSAVTRLTHRLKQTVVGVWEQYSNPESEDQPSNAWIAMLIEHWRRLGNDIEEIAENTNDKETEQELRGIVTDLRKTADHYEDHND